MTDTQYATTEFVVENPEEAHIFNHPNVSSLVGKTMMALCGQRIRIRNDGNHLPICESCMNVYREMTS